MLRRGSSTTTTSSPSIASYHPTSIALTRVSLSAVHMFLTALTDEGFFQSAVDGPMLLWKASGECRGILGILAVPEEGNYQKVASLKVTADKWEGPIERDALTTILVYLASGLTVTNCVDTALKARRDPKVGGYLGVGSTRAIPRRVPALERRERRVFSTVRSAEIGGWRNAIEADILAATVGFGSIRPIWCPLCQTMCDKIGMFAEHIVSDNHRKTLQRVLNEGPTVRALTAEIRQDSGSKPVLARVDLIGNYVVPERNVVKMEEVAVRESELVVSHPQGRSSSMEVDSPRCGIPSDVRKSKVEPPIVDTQADKDDDDEDDDDDVSIMSLN